MRQIPAVRISSLDDALGKLPEICELFTSTGLLKLQGYGLSRSEQLTFVSKMGDIFSWNINTKVVEEAAADTVLDLYVFMGGHSDDPHRSESIASNYAVDWHIEQVFYVDTFLAGFWNMYHIGYEDPKAGNTHFVDSSELYNLLPEEDKDFLNKSVVIWDKPIGPKDGFGPYYTKALDTNKVNGKTTIRLETDGGCIVPVSLYKFGGEDPTPEQSARLDQILALLKQDLALKKDLRYVQQWQKNDMIIVDLFRMYHAVTGGFGYGERKFHGTFTRPANYTNNLYDSMEKL
jgi:alpha-ketoglutarate-dependent taurine dioxygenase